MKVSQAIDIVTRAVLEDATHEGLEWDRWPEIGFDDWMVIQTRIGEMTRSTDDRESYFKAYELLAKRAEGQEA